LMFADVRSFASLFNLSGPDCFAQNNLNQVVRYSVADGLAGNTPVAVGGTVNSNPDSWVQNGVHKSNDKTWNDPSMELSRQVYQQFGQSGYPWSPDMAKTPGPFQTCPPVTH